MNTITGACHCGNIQVAFHTLLAPESLWLRKCPCTFCHKQGNINVADPKGQVTVSISEKDNILFYQMGHKTSDRLFCKTCGVYIGGFMTEGDQSLCVINANILDSSITFSEPTVINVSQQTPTERVAGRLSRWMPFDIAYI